MTIAILATGPSMSQAVADGLAGMPRIVVNDAFRLAPDACALVANDATWWTVNPDALKFAGRRFSCNSVRWVEQVRPRPFIERSTNSGLLALHVAIHYFKAKRVELHGFDMSSANGQHYFGPHTKSRLSNTTPDRFVTFCKQFANYATTIPKDAVIVNATPGSALRVFPFAVEVPA